MTSCGYTRGCPIRQSDDLDHFVVDSAFLDDDFCCCVSAEKERREKCRRLHLAIQTKLVSVGCPAYVLEAGSMASIPDSMKSSVISARNDYSKKQKTDGKNNTSKSRYVIKYS